MTTREQRNQLAEYLVPPAVLWLENLGSNRQELIAERFSRQNARAGASGRLECDDDGDVPDFATYDAR